MAKLSQEKISRIVKDKIDKSWYTFYLRSNSSNANHERSFSYSQSDIKPKLSYYTCDIRGEWESPWIEFAGLGVLLMEKKLEGSVCFSNHPREKSLFLMQSYFVGEKFHRSVSPVIRVNKDVMHFIHQTINLDKDIQISFTLEENPQLFDSLTHFLNSEEPIDMQVVIEDFKIVQ